MYICASQEASPYTLNKLFIYLPLHYTPICLFWPPPVPFPLRCPSQCYSLVTVDVSPHNMALVSPLTFPDQNANLLDVCNPPYFVVCYPHCPSHWPVDFKDPPHTCEQKCLSFAHLYQSLSSSNTQTATLV